MQSRPADDTVQYELKSVQALRGRENSAKAKRHNQGWEFVSENRGTLRTELNFRRAKPKTFGAHLLSFVATFRRLQPKTQSAVVASAALILVAGSIGIVAGTQSRERHPPNRRRQAPPFELLDDSEPSATPKPSEHRAKARARARARAPARAPKKRREQAIQRVRQRNAEGPVFTNCDAAWAAGAAPLQRGTKEYEANANLDRDACESSRVLTLSLSAGEVTVDNRITSRPPGRRPRSLLRRRPPARPRPAIAKRGSRSMLEEVVVG
jgi:Excalibur calcium-binding domain